MAFASGGREFVTRLKGSEEARDEDNPLISARDPRFGALSLTRLWHTASFMYGARLSLKDTVRCFLVTVRRVGKTRLVRVKK